MELWKLQATGNDFILVDDRLDCFTRFARQLNLSKEELVRRVCDRHRGVGADGLILIKPPKESSHCFSWEFYNADGSTAEMCGNGARCAARFAYEKGLCESESFTFETLAGPVEVRVLDRGRRVRVKLTPLSKPRKIKLELEEGALEGVFITAGVPHFVVKVKELGRLPVVRLGRAVRFHPAFEPKGTNVNFVEPVGEDALRIRTYERGVEGETLACGTGATASAAVAYLEGWVKKRPVRVITRSGEEILVEFDDELKEVYLTGPVRKVLTGSLEDEAVKY
ncbi:MAG: diaminopimelate epimerase [Aquificae bacterium]|nr:diaminopimelate epimerase [Aquificota bacterium]